VHSIISKEVLAPAVARFWLEAPAVARNCRAGQFVIVRLREGGERIPLTIADSSRARGTIALVVQAVGKTTRELNAMVPGQAILDVAGPLGRPTNVAARSRVCCVAGGIGAAVVLPIARAFRDAGGTVVSIVGARTRDLVILEAEMRITSDRAIVMTDDGSYGHKGLVTDALREAIASSEESFDEVIAIGPLAMMRAVCELTKPLGLKTTVSLNPIMVDGTGMCGGCRVSIACEQKFVCVDGPDFDGHLVDFDELIARLSTYREEEQAALARYAARGARDAAAT